MKYRMSGPQVLAHPSVFLGRFQSALLDAGVGKKAPPPQSCDRRVRDELVRQFPDGEAGMAAFKASTSEVLRKTGRLPPSPLRSHLRAFVVLDGLTDRAAPDSTLPEIGADQIVEFFRTAPSTEDFFDHVHKKRLQPGFSSAEEMATGIYLGAAGLSKLSAAEAAQIQAQMDAFIVRLDRS